LGNAQWDIPRLRQLLEEILRQNNVFENFEVEHDFPGIGVRTMMLNARRLEAQPGYPGLILLALEDVTGRDPSCKGQDHER
jgi:chemotaxis protein methyltransferase CheR